MPKFKLLHTSLLILTFLASSALANPAGTYCKFPRTFKVNKYDKRFGISKGEFRLALKNAANLWNQGTQKFILKEIYVGEADININMEYGAGFVFYKKANEIMSKGMQITSDYKEFNRMQKNFKADYNKLKREGEKLNLKHSNLNSEIKAYNNSPKKSQLRLNQLKLEKERVKTQLEQFKIKTKDFEKNTKFLQDWFKLINDKNTEYQKQSKLLKQMQRGTLDYSLAGLYQNFSGNEIISLFLFNDRQTLTNVLAHEFGHALGVKHVNDEKALMYKFANDKNKKLKRITISDYLAFVSICRR